jgi:hypothetical protein
MNIPYGCCKCGCGGKTTIAKWNDCYNGRVRGEPLSYLTGHHGRGQKGEQSTSWRGGQTTTCRGYVGIYAPSHPRATDNNLYVFEHILVVEECLGRYLENSEQVHHLNRIKSDNRSDNLILCASGAHHSLLHQRQRAFDACGNADYRKCPFCKEYDNPVNMTEHKYRKRASTYHHHKCNIRFRREWRMAKEIECQNQI